MLAGLRSAFRKSVSDPTNNDSVVRSSAELDKMLAEDAKNRKKCISNVCWFHETVKTRHAAETKLKQAYGLDELVRFYQQHENTRELPCRLLKPCPDGHPPPSLSLSVGYTNVLHKSIVAGNSETALKILLHSACPPLDDRDEKGNTALHLACIAGLDEVAETLVHKGADVSAMVSAYSNCGYSALQLACKCNHVSIVRMLLVKGEACPQQRVATTGNVSLHLAAELGHIEIVKMLLSFDVPSHARNYAQKTPFELAVDNQHHESAQFIDDYEPPPAVTDQKDWFHEKINRAESCKLLTKFIELNGIFLVRKSSKNNDDLVLDLCYQRRIKHYVISNLMNFFFIDPGPFLPSLEHLIEYYCVYSDGLVTALQYALSTSGEVVSLRALSEGFHTKFGPEIVERKMPPMASEPMVLSKDSIETSYELGQGEYGSVLKGTWKAPSGELVPVAIKTLNQQHLVSGTEGFKREALVMVQLDHPCIVKLIGICEGPPLMLVQELLSMGSLLDFLLDFPEKLNIDVDFPLWASQIAFGMKYLEKNGLVHRDLAARNILLASKSQVKICDFGLSRAIGTNSDYYRASQGGRWPVKWYAPESINYGTFSSASDVWGYGVTLWEMYTFGDQPYNEMTGAQVLKYVERKGRLAQPEECPDSMYLLMKRCWSFKSADRPTFKQIYHELQLTKNYENIQTLSIS